MKRRSVVLLFAMLLLSGLGTPAFGEKLDKPPRGMGKFLLFLKHAPPVAPGHVAKKIVPPDVEKLGGQVLQKTDDYRLISIPLAAAKQLREDENVDYLQRVWMGETQEEWDATEALQRPAASLMRLRNDTLTETASWGPKTYSYDGTGNISRIEEFDANQNVKTIGTETYRYDAVSRLTQAVVNGVTETYVYDGFGNLTQKQTGGEPARTVPVDRTSNRITDATYDIAGDVTVDPRKRFGTYTYDSMGMLVAMPAGTNYKRMYYTADDERIGFSLNTYFSRWMIRDFEGRPLREFRTDSPISWLEDATWIWTEDYVYASGQLVGGETAGPYGLNQATIATDRRRRHFHLDHLGSVRLITTDAAAVALGVHNYYPFGAEQSTINQEELNFGGSAVIRPEPLRFTGHERDFNGVWNIDNEDYLDYMHARYYEPFQGRFMSPDPMLDFEEALPNPQRWNHYSYVSNNPVNKSDPNGREEKLVIRSLRMVAQGLSLTRNLPLTMVADTLNDVADYASATDALHNHVLGNERLSSEQLKATWKTGTLASLKIAAALIPEMEAANGVKGGKGAIMLGHHPDYLIAGEKFGAQVFNIPMEIWNKMGKAEQLALNRKFIDQAIAHGDEILLATNPAKVRNVSGLQEELQYLISLKFKIVEDIERGIWKLVK